jgi:hypothetical protein
VAHTHDLRTDCRGGSQLAKAGAERNLWICASDFHEQTSVSRQAGCPCHSGEVIE